MTLARILLPTDFSDTAGLALDYARELAARFGADVHLLHVVPDLKAQYWTVEVESVISDLVETRKADAERDLGALSLDGVETVRTVRVGDPFVEIVRYVADNAIDLVVMGTHGRGPVEHLLLGSVAEKVVRKASCPVLTVKEAEHMFVVPRASDPAS